MGQRGPRPVDANRRRKPTLSIVCTTRHLRHPNSAERPLLPQAASVLCQHPPYHCATHTLNRRPRPRPHQSRAHARSEPGNEEYRSFQHRGDRRARKWEFSAPQCPTQGSRRSLSIATPWGRAGPTSLGPGVPHAEAVGLVCLVADIAALTSPAAGESGALVWLRKP
jgi:hypothetical protein